MGVWTFLEATPARHPICRFTLAMVQQVNIGVTITMPWPFRLHKDGNSTTCAWTLMHQVASSLTIGSAQAVRGRRKSGKSTMLLQKLPRTLWLRGLVQLSIPLQPTVEPLRPTTAAWMDAMMTPIAPNAPSCVLQSAKSPPRWMLLHRRQQLSGTFLSERAGVIKACILNLQYLSTRCGHFMWHRLF